MSANLVDHMYIFCRTLFLCFVCVSGTISTAFANCVPGETQTVVACDNLSCTARWDGRCSRSCTWNPPPGWAIVDTNVEVLSSSSGSREVSVLAGGSNFISSVEIDAAMSRLDSISGEFVGEDGAQKNFSGRVNQAYNQYLSEYRKYSASENTVHATVSAEGSGDYFSRARGWSTIRVKANLTCLGAPGGLDQLVKSIVSKAGVNVGNIIRVESQCRGLRVALRYLTLGGEWKNDWFTIEGSGSYASRDNGEYIRTDNRVVYIWAYDKMGSGRVRYLGGDSDDGGSVRRTIEIPWSPYKERVYMKRVSLRNAVDGRNFAFHLGSCALPGIKEDLSGWR